MARHPPAERALVVIDQLEELFTMAAADERQRFIAVLEALRANTPCCFVLALRSDFFSALMDSALVGPGQPVTARGRTAARECVADRCRGSRTRVRVRLGGGRLGVAPDLVARAVSAGAAGIAEAITTPAMRVDVHVEARLSDRLVADAADEPGMLPLVQETLRPTGTPLGRGRRSRAVTRAAAPRRASPDHRRRRFAGYDMPREASNTLDLRHIR